MAIKPVIQPKPSGTRTVGPSLEPGVGDFWGGAQGQDADWDPRGGGWRPRSPGSIPGDRLPAEPKAPLRKPPGVDNRTPEQILQALANGTMSYADPAYRRRVEEQKTRLGALARSNLGMGTGSRQQAASNAQAVMTQGTNYNAKQLRLREQDDARSALAAAIAAQQAGDLEASQMLLDSLKQKYENREAPGTPWWLSSAGSVAGPVTGWYLNQNQQQSQSPTVDALNRANRGY